MTTVHIDIVFGLHLQLRSYHMHCLSGMCAIIEEKRGSHTEADGIFWSGFKGASTLFLDVVQLLRSS